MFAWSILTIALAVGLMLISFFVKGMLVYFMCACAWLGVVFACDQTWVQITASIGVVWAGGGREGYNSLRKERILRYYAPQNDKLEG